MKQYIGTKIIEAEPAYRCMDGQGRVTITDDPSEAFPNFPSVEDGYRVRYADGYVSWSPKDTFERAYLPLETNKELRASKPSISQEMVDNFILETWTQTAGEKTTIVRAMLRNGFELEAWYITPGEVQNAEDICFCCDECKHYDGDFSKRSQWRPDCPRHKFPEKYLEMQRIVEQRRARAAETRRRNFQIIKGGKP